MRRRPRRSLSSNHARPPLSLSYPTIGSHHSRSLVSVKSEGAATAMKDNEVRGFTRNVANPPLQSTNQWGHHEDDSSDDSAVEEDIIVKIDSPSGLSFHPSS